MRDETPVKRAIVVTAYDRPQLLNDTLGCLASLRSTEHWDIYISIDPAESADVRQQVIDVAMAFREEFMAGSADRPRRFATDPIVLIQNAKLGVLEHPYVLFETLFGLGYDYILRLEDDMSFTNDLLEYHEWASEEFYGRQDVVMVESRSGVHEHMNEGEQDEILVVPEFGSPLAIGTWRDSWRKWLAPTWDRDYSTYEGVPGNKSGFDWNLALRVYPLYGLYSVRPAADKVWHHGVWGTHSTPDVYETRPPLPGIVYEQQYKVREL